MISLAGNAVSPINPDEQGRPPEGDRSAKFASSAPGAPQRRWFSGNEQATVARERIPARATHLWHAWLVAGQPAVLFLAVDDVGLELAVEPPRGHPLVPQHNGGVNQFLVVKPDQGGRYTIRIRNRSRAAIEYELLLP